MPAAIPVSFLLSLPCELGFVSLTYGDVEVRELYMHLLAS
jgi:hypothetical protein